MGPLRRQGRQVRQAGTTWRELAMVLLRVRAAFPAKDTGFSVPEDQKVGKHPLHVPTHEPLQAVQFRRSPENQGSHVPGRVGPVGPPKARETNLPTGGMTDRPVQGP